MGNNINDISAFEKIVFVDNINNEYDAAQLSEDFPFAFILTNETKEGLNNGILYENDHLIDHKETNGIIVENKPSGNIWKGGKRLTKFVNIDNERNVVQFDAYDLRLAFDKMSGLLSFFKVPKVQDFRLVSLFYKEKDINSSNNDAYRIKTYVNKTKILNDFGDGSADQCRIMKNDFGIYNTEDLNNLLNNFHDLQKDENDLEANSYDIWEDNENKGFVNAIDNKFYIVVRFEANNDSALNTVSADSFIMSQVNDIFDISKNSVFLNDQNDLMKFMGITTGELNNIETLNTDLDNVGKVTYKYKYSSESYGKDGYSPGRYTIYELQLKNLADDYHLYNFNFKNAANLPQLNIGIDQLFVNSISYRLLINEREINLNSEDISAYIMPGDTIKCRFEVNPQKISNDYELTVTLNNNNFKFKVGEEYLDSITIDNANVDELGNNNNFMFTIAATDSFDFYTGETNYLDSITSTLGLNFKKNGNTIWQNNSKKIRKYAWVDWEYNKKPFDSSNTAISGTPVIFNTNKIYCVFSTDINGTVREKKDITDDVNVTFIFNQGIEGNNVDNNNGGLPLSDIPCDTDVEIHVPFIFRASENAKFYAAYTYKDQTVYTNKIQITPDILDKIELKNGITFNDYNNSSTVVDSIESGSSIEIKRNISDDTYIVFTYLNSGPINAYKYLYSTLEEFQRDIRIGLSNTEHDENGKIKENGTPYVEIKNNKLIYNSDDADEQSNTIELYLSYTDPNRENYVKKSDTISFTVNKVVIDWWMYIGDIGHVELDNLREIKDIEYKIPDFPTNLDDLAELHKINDLRTPEYEDEVDVTDVYCGKLYEYTNINNPSSNNYEYIENTQNPTQERSFGTWIHLGNLDDPNVRNSTLLKKLKIGEDNDKLFYVPTTVFTDNGTLTTVLYTGSGNTVVTSTGSSNVERTGYTIILLPSILELRSDPNNKILWPSSCIKSRESCGGKYGKGNYVAYIVTPETYTETINGETYSYTGGLYWGIYYVNAIQQ